MNEVIRTRREILKHIETLAEENADGRQVVQVAREVAGTIIH